MDDQTPIPDEWVDAYQDAYHGHNCTDELACCERAGLAAVVPLAEARAAAQHPCANGCAIAGEALQAATDDLVAGAWESMPDTSPQRSPLFDPKVWMPPVIVSDAVQGQDVFIVSPVMARQIHDMDPDTWHAASWSSEGACCWCPPDPPEAGHA